MEQSCVKVESYFIIYFEVLISISKASEIWSLNWEKMEKILALTKQNHVIYVDVNLEAE